MPIPLSPPWSYYNPLRVWVGAWVGLLEECFLSCVVDGFSFFSVISPPLLPRRGVAGAAVVSAVPIGVIIRLNSRSCPHPQRILLPSVRPLPLTPPSVFVSFNSPTL